LPRLFCRYGEALEGTSAGVREAREGAGGAIGIGAGRAATAVCDGIGAARSGGA
jgi:hypothetical protein